jgi:DNA-binding LacI/PurR family transcriptional regulator
MPDRRSDVAKTGARPPRQSDIARVAGVSQATVSVVLSGRSAENSIPAATQRRVLETAEILGYVPNINARSLRGGRNGLIGVHTFEPVFPVTRDDYYHEFLVGIEEQAVRMGLDLVLFASTQGPDGTRSIYGNGSNRLRLADGAVLLGFSRTTEELDRLAREEYPFVFIGRRDGVSTRMPYVAPDYHAALGDIRTQLGEAGHASVAYLGGIERTAPQDDRLAAFIAHGRRLGLRTEPPLFIAPASLDADLLHRMIGAGVTAVVAESHELAAALTAVAAPADIAVPGALSLVCLDVGVRVAGAQDWSHIEVPRRELGRRAVAVLMDFLDDKIPPDFHELLPVTPATYATIAAPDVRASTPADADPARKRARPGKGRRPAREHDVPTG